MSRLLRWIGPVLLAFAVLALAEGLFALSDRGTPPQQHSLLRGFDDEARSFVADERNGWRLLDSDGLPTDLRVPPKSPNRVRILLFGGSNVEGFPERALQSRLERYAPDTRWEVINLGRSGYGSARVVRLFEHALERLEPDLVVIYAGHNEFVERGFQLDVEAQWQSGWQTSLAESAQRLRTVNVLAAAMTPEQERDEEEDWKNEEDKFRGFTLEQSLHQLSWFDQNLTHAAQLAKSHGVPLLLCTVVFNHFAMPFTATHEASLSAAEIERFDKHMAAALSLYPREIKALLPPSNGQRLHPADWRKCPFEQFKQGGQIPEPRPLRGMLAEFGMHPPPESCWSGKVRPFYEAVVAFHAAQPSPELERAELQLKAALELAPEHAFALFQLGIVSYVLDRDLETVTELLDRAGDNDCVPRRASRAINERTRRVASQQGVPLLDCEALFRTRVPEGLIGWETMRDQCHLHRGARLAVMADMGSFIAGLPELQERLQR